MHKITVLHLCEHFGNREVSFHGMARLFELWIPSFDTTRFRILVISRKALRELSDQRLRAAGIEPLYLGYGPFDPRNLFKLMAIMRREKVDVLHVHGYGASLWGRTAGIWLGKPVIVHEHCNFGNVPFYLRPVEWLLGHFTSHSYAVSESTRQFTIDKRYIPAAKVETLYSGILLDQIHRVGPAWIKSFREEQGRRPEDKILGIVGRLEPHKAHIDAFRAMQLILKERSDVFLWILGDGHYKDTLHRWVRDNNLTDRITFLGYRTDVIKVIQCFDLQLFPSHMEGTPSTLFEAMAVGNSCVASTADGQGEILQDGVHALLFTPGDIKALAGLTLKLLADPELAGLLGRNSLARVQRFDMKQSLRTMEAKYEEIAPLPDLALLETTSGKG